MHLMVNDLQNDYHDYAKIIIILFIFPGYRVQWEEESTTVSCLHTLNESSLGYEYHCTDLSWNSTGSVVGVAFGKFDHHDWCSHKVRKYVMFMNDHGWEWMLPFPCSPCYALGMWTGGLWTAIKLMSALMYR
jgi:hypothetical protein